MGRYIAAFAGRGSAPKRRSKVSVKKKYIIPLAVVAGFAVASNAGAAPPLVPFGEGDVTVNGTDVEIVNDLVGGEYGQEYSGVYINARSLNNKLLANVVVSFTSTGEVTGGALRMNIPIDVDGDKTMDLYATIDAANTISDDAESIWVSTENPNTPVYFLDQDLLDDVTETYYENWDAFVEARPAYRVASKGAGSTAFLIADQAGTYVAENVDLQ
jgi:hypothetical protein